MKHLKTFEAYADVYAGQEEKVKEKEKVKTPGRTTRPSPIRRDNPSKKPKPSAFKPEKLKMASAEDVIAKANELSKNINKYYVKKI